MSSHIVMSNNQGASTLTATPLPEFSDLDIPGWQGLSREDSGVFMFMFNIAADAEEFPIHADEAQWLALVISGSGTLYAGTTDLEKTDGINYVAGDFITFEANTPHGWKNGGTSSRILFVKPA
ncbi:MAG: hypothetical protein WBM87_06295 [Woeseiaceae bacterium]